MKCPKCGVDIPEGTTTCPSCGFSSTIDGVSVQSTIVEAPVVPEIVSAPVVTEEKKEEVQPVPETPVEEVKEEIVEAPAVEALVVDAPAVDAPAVEAPVVDAPVVDAPAVDAPVVEAPVVDAPAVEAPVVEAPAVDAPAVEAPVVEAPAVEAPAVEAPVAPVAPAASVAQTPAQSAETPAATPNVEVKPVEGALKDKKNIAVFIVIGVLTVIALVLVVLLIFNGANSQTIGPVDDETTNETENSNEPTISNKDDDEDKDEDAVKNGVITLYNVKFSVPKGFEVENTDNYYSIFNTSLRKIFILEDMYTGDETELSAGLNIMKSEYPANGCTDINVQELTSDNIKYGLVTYNYDGSSYHELYALLDNQYIVAFYNLQTNLVTKDEFVNYALEVAKSGKDQGAVFGNNDVMTPWDHTRKDITLNYNFE